MKSQRGVFSAPHSSKILFSEPIEIQTNSLPRWKPQIVVTKTMDQSEQTYDELTEAKYELRNEIISALNSWLIAEQQNRSCGEAIDIVEALENFIDFKIQQALKQLSNAAE